MEERKKKVLSLFSGCGGMDLGFEGGFEAIEQSINHHLHPGWIEKYTRKGRVKLKKTGFQTVFANDIRPGAKSAWVPYFTQRGLKNAEQVFHLGSIVDFVKKTRSGIKNVFPDSVDLITGGFPCQDFSVAGKRKGFSSHKSHIGKSFTDSDNPDFENRGMLYMWMRDVIDIVRPKMFIAENVKGLVSLANAREIIENDFKNVGDGYLVIPARVLKASEYGVPQKRERVFFIGFHRKALKKEALVALEKESIPLDYDPYPRPTHLCVSDTLNSQRSSGYSKGGLLPFVAVEKALCGLPEPEDANEDLSQQAYSKARWYGKHCQGQVEVNLKGLGPTIRSEHHGNIEYRRLNKEHGGVHQDELKKGLKERRLTVRECARLQTFPDNYEFVRKPDKNKPGLNLSGSEAYKLIGNAVPPLLAYHMASRLSELWEKLFKN